MAATATFNPPSLSLSLSLCARVGKVFGQDRDFRVWSWGLGANGVLVVGNKLF